MLTDRKSNADRQEIGRSLYSRPNFKLNRTAALAE